MILARQALGIKGIIFDKDNTLTAPYVDELHPSLRAAFRRCMASFDGRVCVMSNSAGTNDDVGFASATRIETRLGIPVLRHEEKKPGGLDEVLAFFRQQCGDEGVAARDLCVIGDRLLTDVVFGNLHGMLTVHTKVRDGSVCEPCACAAAVKFSSIINASACRLLMACTASRCQRHLVLTFCMLAICSMVMRSSAATAQPLTLEGDNRVAAVARFIESRIFFNIVQAGFNVDAPEHRLSPSLSQLILKEQHGEDGDGDGGAGGAASNGETGADVNAHAYAKQ
jgi:phosphatidylglycerophosphatase GEP4